ncbi:MAG: hypothetical protein Q9182_002814 [Xanthomendoza sp. 2 TL-2023]
MAFSKTKKPCSAEPSNFRRHRQTPVGPTEIDGITTERQLLGLIRFFEFLTALSVLALVPILASDSIKFYQQGLLVWLSTALASIRSSVAPGFRIVLEAGLDLINVTWLTGALAFIRSSVAQGLEFMRGAVRYFINVTWTLLPPGLRVYAF